MYAEGVSPTWIAALFALPGTDPDFAFADVSDAGGIRTYFQAPGMGGGVAIADFDGDGDVDLFVPNRQGVADQLYRNRGDGTFDEVAAEVGLASFGHSRAALWVDVDGDHDLDLVVARDGFVAGDADPPRHSLQLFLQTPEGSFANATVGSGLEGPLHAGKGTHVGGLAAGDFDRDGYLDLFFAQWQGPSYLFRNTGLGTFVDVSTPSGVGELLGTNWAPLFCDVDRDGWEDLFVATDFFPNRLWRNRGDGTFEDVAASAGVDDAWNDMGAAFGDYDNDGDLDLYVTNVTDDFVGVKRHNVLYANRAETGTLVFDEVAEAAGVADGFWGWGATFLDANRDGLLDLAATNGTDGAPWSTDPSRFFLNRGGAPVVFAEVSAQVGFADELIGSGLAAADLDRDGRLDLVHAARRERPNAPGALRVLKNVGNGSDEEHYLVVQPRMPGPNRFAIGALVRVTVGGTTQTRLISAGTSFLSQEPAEAVFAWEGPSTTALVEIEWPGGGAKSVPGVAADQVIEILL